MTEPALTVHEVAKRLKFSPATVREMILARVIRGVKLCGRWRVDPSEIDRLFRKDDPARKRSRQRAMVAMVKSGLPPHLGVAALECAGIAEPSECRCGP